MDRRTINFVFEIPFYNCALIAIAKDLVERVWKCMRNLMLPLIEELMRSGCDEMMSKPGLKPTLSP